MGIRLDGTTDTISAPGSDLNLGQSGDSVKVASQVQLPTHGALSNRNIFVNGGARIAQRGTSATGVTGSAYQTVDQFKTSISALGTWTVTQETDAPAGFANSFKMDCTTADASPTSGGVAAIDTFVEAQDLQVLEYGSSSAVAATLSFYVKSNKTGSGTVSILQPDNSERCLNVSYTISSANTWERKTISLPADASGVINNDTGRGLGMEFWLNSGSTYTGGSAQNTWGSLTQSNRNFANLGVGGSTADYWMITGVQLELGEKATPFEHRSYGDELARCQRYFRRFCEGVQYAPAPGSGYGVSSTSAYHKVDLSPEMRSVPTLADFSNLRTDDVSGGQAITALSLVSSMSSTEAVFLNATSASGLTQYRTYALLANNTTGAKLDLSAEL